MGGAWNLMGEYGPHRSPQPVLCSASADLDVMSVK